MGEWAFDTKAAMGTGVDALHAWAYPTPGSGTNPYFLGQATYEAHGPDAGVLFGSHLPDSGYGLTITGRDPGRYDILVEAQSMVTVGCSGRLSTAVTIVGEKNVEKVKTDDAHLYAGQQMIPDLEPQEWNSRIHYARHFYALGFVGRTPAVPDAGCGVGYGIQLVPLKTTGKCSSVDHPKNVIDHAQERYPATASCDLCVWSNPCRFLLCHPVALPRRLE